jgi:hypothetical protein
MGTRTRGIRMVGKREEITHLGEETLMEIEDYIQALDEQVGLKNETLTDVGHAIAVLRADLRHKKVGNENKMVDTTKK